MDFAKAVEILKTIASTVADNDNAVPATTPAYNKQQKIKACNVIATQMSIEENQNSQPLMKLAVHCLLRATGDVDTDVRMAADEALKKIINSAIHRHVDKILVMLFKGIKLFPNSLSQRASLENFANVCDRIKPQKCRTFVTFLLPQLCNLFATADPIVMAIMGQSFSRIMVTLGFYFTEPEFQKLFHSITPTLSNSTEQIRRTGAICISQMCKYIPHTNFNEVTMSIHEMATSTIHEKNLNNDQDAEGDTNKTNHKEGVYVCLAPNCLQGCIYTFIQLLDVMDAVGRRRGLNPFTHYQPFINLASDLITQSLFIREEQNVLSSALELLSRLLSQYGDYCRNWRKEKVLAHLRTLFELLASEKTRVTIKNHVLEILAKLSVLFTPIFVKFIRVAREMSILDIISLTDDDDYLLRGNTYIFIGSLIAGIVIHGLEGVPVRPPILKSGANNTQLAELQPESDQGEPFTPTPIKIHTTETLLNHMTSCIEKETTSLAKKMMFASFGICLPQMFRANHHQQQPSDGQSGSGPSPQLIRSLLDTVYQLLHVQDSFWSVKLEILEFIQKLNYTVVYYYESTTIEMGQFLCDSHERTIQSIVLRKVFDWLTDEDPRVRDKAADTLFSILPSLYFPKSNDRGITSQAILKDLIAQKIGEKEKRRLDKKNLVSAKEVSNLSHILTAVTKKLSEMHLDKSTLLGLVTFINSLAKKYASYDETSFYFVKEGFSMLQSFFCEIIDRELNLAKCSPFADDLTTQTLLVESIGLHFIHCVNANYANGEPTGEVGRYIMCIMNILSDTVALDQEQTNAGASTTTSATASGTTTTTANTASAEKNRFLPSYAYSSLLEKLNRARKSAKLTLNSNDTFSEFRAKCLKTLYFFIRFGERRAVITETVNIVNQLTVHIQEDPENVVLCLQELFVCVFATAQTMLLTDQNLAAVMLPNNKLEHVLQQSHAILMHQFDNNSSNTIAPPPRIANKTKKDILVLFEPLVINEIRNFRYTHSSRFQSVILFMLSRMVNIGVDFTRLDKDSTFLRHLLQMVAELDTSMPNPDRSLHDIIELISILLSNTYVRSSSQNGTQVDAILNEETMLETVSAALSSKCWSPSILIESFTPLLLRCYWFNPPTQSSAEAAERSEKFAFDLFQIILDNMHFTQAYKVLTKVLEKVRATNEDLYERLSEMVFEKFVSKLDELNIDTLQLEKEIHVIFTLLETLHCKSVSLLTCVQKINSFILDEHNQQQEIFLLKLLLLMKLVCKSSMEDMESSYAALVDLFLVIILKTQDVLLSVQKKPQQKEYFNIIFVRTLDQFNSLMDKGFSNHLEFEDRSSVFDVTKLEEIHANFCRHMKQRKGPSLNVLSSYMNFFMKASQNCKNITFSSLMLKDLIERFHSGNVDSKFYTDVIIRNMYFFVVCNMVVNMSTNEDGKQIISSFAEQIFTNKFWGYVLYNADEDVTRKLLNKLSATKVNGVVSVVNSRLSEFISQLLTGATGANAAVPSRRLIDLRRTSAFIKKMPQFAHAAIFEVILKQYSNKRNPLLEKRVLEECLQFLARSNEALQDDLAQAKASLSLDIDVVVENVVEDISSLKKDKPVHQNSKLSNSFAFKHLQGQLPLKYAAHVLCNLSNDNLRDLLNASLHTKDLSFLTNTIHNVKTMDQLRLLTNFVLRRAEQGAEDDKQLWVLAASLSAALRQSHQVEQQQGTAQLLTADQITVTLSLFGLLLKELDNNLTPNNVDTVLQLTLDLLTYVPEQDLKDNHGFSTFTFLVCQLLLQIMNTNAQSQPSWKEAREVPDEEVTGLIKRVLDIVYPFDFQKSELYIGRAVPYVKHELCLRQIGAQLARLYMELAYAPFIEAATEDPGMVDTHIILTLTRLFNEISCTEQIFNQLWKSYFGLFVSLCGANERVDEMQIYLFKFLSKLLFSIELNSSDQKPRDSKPQDSETLDMLSTSVKKYLFTSDKTQYRRNPVIIVVDQVNVRQQFNDLAKFIEDTLQKQMRTKLLLVKEMVKSIALLITKKPFYFAKVTSGDVMDPLYNVSQKYTYEWVFTTFMSVHSDVTYNSDAVMKRYLVLGMTAAFGFFDLRKEKEKDSGAGDYITKNLDAAIGETHIQNFAFLGILALIKYKRTMIVDGLLPSLKDKMQLCSATANTVLSQILMLRVVEEVIENLPAEAGMHDFTRKALESLFNMAEQDEYAVRVIEGIYSTLEHLLATYSLSHIQRELIAALTSYRMSAAGSSNAKLALPPPPTSSSTPAAIRTPSPLKPQPTPATPTAQQATPTATLSTKDKFAKMFKLGKPQSAAPKPATPVATSAPTPTPSAVATPGSSPSPGIRPSSSTSQLSSILKAGDAQQNQQKTSTPSLFNNLASSLTRSRSQLLPPNEASPGAAASTTSSAPVVTKDTPTTATTTTRREQTSRLHVYTQRSLLISLMATTMYTGDESGDINTDTEMSNNNGSNTSSIFVNLSEKGRTNVLHLLQQFHKTTLNRQSELVLKFLPHLLEDFFESGQVLPLVLGEFLGPHTHPLLLSSVLSTRIPRLYEEELDFQEDLKQNPQQQREQQRRATFQDWIDVCLESICTKRPVPLALWGLLCLFVSVCGCVYPHYNAMLPEIGSCVPQRTIDSRLLRKHQPNNNTSPGGGGGGDANNKRHSLSRFATVEYVIDEKFAHNFLLLGVCFYNFLSSSSSEQPVMGTMIKQRNTLVRVLKTIDDADKTGQFYKLAGRLLRMCEQQQQQQQ